MSKAATCNKIQMQIYANITEFIPRIKLNYNIFVPDLYKKFHSSLKLKSDWFIKATQ